MKFGHCVDCGLSLDYCGRGKPKTRCEPCAKQNNSRRACRRHGCAERGICKKCGSNCRAFTCDSCKRKGKREEVRARRAKGWKAPRLKITFACRGCGIEYHPRSKVYNKYCSRDCAFKDSKKRYDTDVHKANRKKADPKARYREHLKLGYRLTPCVQCGVLHARRSEYCSPSCVRAASPRERVCDTCGVLFCGIPGYRLNKFCSDDCRHITRVSNRTKHRKLRRQKGLDDRGKFRKKAKRLGVVYERISTTRVFERDGWRCQICGKHTPKAKRGTYHHSAPELDHRIPMSKGGSHTYGNTQCTCRKCNGDKSNRSETGQMPLFAA